MHARCSTVLSLIQRINEDCATSTTHGGAHTIAVDRGDHDRAAVASQGVAQHLGHHGVAIGDVGAVEPHGALLQRDDHLRPRTTPYQW